MIIIPICVAVSLCWCRDAAYFGSEYVFYHLKGTRGSCLKPRFSPEWNFNNEATVTLQESFQLAEQKNLVWHTVKSKRERDVFSYHLPLNCTIPGRNRDESKLCLTNTLVLFSLHGELARTADIITSKIIFPLNISLSLAPRQTCTAAAQLFIPQGSSAPLQSIWAF